MTSLPAKWPHFLGNTWSSICSPAAPARSSTRTVRTMLTALPKPVSASTISGSATASAMADTALAISVRVVRPMSGAPRCMLATPAPVT